MAKRIVNLLLIFTLIFGFMLPLSAFAETITKTFPESTSRNQTQTMTIPNLQSVNSVSVNTGNVSYTVNGETITFTFTNGDYSRRVQTGGSPAGSKYISNYGNGGSIVATVGGNSYCPGYVNNNRGPSTIYYSDGQGYSGTLSIYEKGYTSYEKDCDGDGSIDQEVFTFHYAYQGTVSKPDTRTYQNYYQYTVTVDYTNGPPNPITNVTAVSENSIEVIDVQTYEQSVERQFILALNGSVITSSGWMPDDRYTFTNLNPNEIYDIKVEVRYP